MAMVRIMAWAALVVAVSSVAWGEDATYSLVPALRPDSATAVRAKYDVSGHLKILSGEQVKELPLSVAARSEYTERPATSGALGVAGHRTLRHYSLLEAKVTVDGSSMEPDLRDSRRLIVLDGNDKELALYSPLGPLTRDELDLIDIPGPTPMWQALLPTDPVAVGDSWEIEPAFWARMLRVDVVSQAELSAELTRVDGSRAIVDCAGHVHAAIGGVATEFEVKLRVAFDLDARRITHAVLALKEDRSIGHVGPGVSATSKVQFVFEPVDMPEPLSPAAIKGLSIEPVRGVLQLTQHFPGTGSFDHPRDWYVLTADARRATLRLIRNGELLAQANIVVPQPRQPGKLIDLEEFKSGIRAGLGASFGKFVEAGHADQGPGQKIQRVSVSGIAADLAIRWKYFLVNDVATGREVIFTFVVEEPLLEDFGTLDWDLVGGFEFAADPAPQPAAAN